MVAKWPQSERPDRPAERFNLRGASEAFGGAEPIAKLFLEVLETRQCLLKTYTDDEELHRSFAGAVTNAIGVINELEEGQARVLALQEELED